MLYRGGQRPAGRQGGRSGSDRGCFGPSGTARIGMGLVAFAADGLGAIAIASAFTSAEAFAAIMTLLSASAAVAIPSAKAVAAFTAGAAITVESAFTRGPFGAFAHRAFAAFGTFRARATLAAIPVVAIRFAIAGGTFAAFEGRAGGAVGGAIGGAVLVLAAFAIEFVDFDRLQFQLRGHLLDDGLFEQVGNGAEFEEEIDA